MNPSNCTSSTPLILVLTLKVKSQDVSFESVLSMNPTSGLKFGPIFRRSTIPSSQFDRYDSDAPASLAPLGSPGDRFPATWASTNQSLKKMRRGFTPPRLLETLLLFSPPLSMSLPPV